MSSDDEFECIDPVAEKLIEGYNADIFNYSIKTEWHYRDGVLIPFPKASVDMFTTKFLVTQQGGGPSTLGSLERLPLEIKTLIVNRMDLATIVRFMHTNRSARAVVQQVPEFKLITKYAGDSAFLAALVTRVSHFIGLGHIMHVLTRWQCKTCRNFAEMVFFPTMERCCRYCLENYGNYEVRDISLTTRPPGINPRIPVLTGDPAFWVHNAVTNIPTQLPLRWAYRGPGWKWDMHMLRIFPSDMQESVLGPELVRQTGASKLPEHGEWTVCRVPTVENPWGLRQFGTDEDCPEIRSGYLATIPVPYLKDRSTGEVVREGVRCIGGCKGPNGGKVMMSTTFLEEHFPRCNKAKKAFLDQRGSRGRGDHADVVITEEDEDEDEEEEGSEEEEGDEDDELSVVMIPRGASLD